MMRLFDEDFRRRLSACHQEASRVGTRGRSWSGVIRSTNDQYRDPPGWAIGPFARDETPAFRKETAWADPAGIGWDSSALWNPSLIERDGILHLFYRAGPAMESMSSRIGHAAWDGTRWKDFEGNPVIYPVDDEEVFGCEDPKVYKAGDWYFLFYNGAYPVPPGALRGVPEAEIASREIAVDVRLAVSRDLVHWERAGTVVPTVVSRYWAKAAVIPRTPAGEAVRVGGRYLMFLSEGCGKQQHVGFSTDMVHWTFRPEPYLPLPAAFGQLHEIACAVTGFEPTGRQLVMDLYHSLPDGGKGAVQVLYDTREPLRPLAFSPGGTRAWGGLIQYRGRWLFGQGWEVPSGRQEIWFYSAPVRRKEQ